MPQIYKVFPLKKRYPQALIKKLRLETWPYPERHNYNCHYLRFDDDLEPETPLALLEWALLATEVTNKRSSEITISKFHQVFSRDLYFDSLDYNGTILIPTSGKQTASIEIKTLTGELIEVPFKLGEFYLIKESELFSIINPNLAYMTFITINLSY